MAVDDCKQCTHTKLHELSRSKGQHIFVCSTGPAQAAVKDDNGCINAVQAGNIMLPSSALPLQTVRVCDIATQCLVSISCSKCWQST